MLIPFASCAATGFAPALAALRLPHLQRLAAALGAPVLRAGSATALSMPHEHALAQARGLDVPDGLVPLAAWDAERQGHAPGHHAWAWITPCHWRVGTDHVRMAHPAELQLQEDESRALLAAMQPYLAEDGITTFYIAPLRWLAHGEFFRALPSASLERVAGRVIDAWMPQGDAGRPLRRLQQEMQMLMYTLPLNDERQRRGLTPVNSLWISGTGALPAAPAATGGHAVELADALQAPALAGDVDAWTRAWQALDTSHLQALADRQARGEPVRLTLCGEHSARHWDGSAAGLWQKMRARMLPAAPATLLEGLS